jgi:GDP-mannose 6-dehydrogenase
MDISVFGLGYVGTVSAACLARDGHRIVGVDISEAKVDRINQGEAPIIEADIAELVGDGVRCGRLSATTDAECAVEQSDMAVICVGTPSIDNGGLDTQYVERVTAQIGELIRGRARPFLFVLRSTVLPGTVGSLVIPTIEEHSGRRVGDGYEVLFHPEFLREGTAVKDFYDPPKIVVGERFPGAGQPVIDLYEGIDSPRFVTSIEVAEMVKYTDNAFHAVKITFANEIGRFCEAHDVDSREVMDIFCADTKLNISSKYLRPGFAFGGSCLPKDVRALLYAASSQGLSLPMLEGVLPSNVAQIEQAMRSVLKNGTRKVGLVGLSFKPGTDDLRESPLVELAERLIGKGIDLKIWDDNVRDAWLVGSNKAYVEKRLPHLVELLVSSGESLDDCDMIVVGHPLDRERLYGWLEQGIDVLDLVGSADSVAHPRYQGIAW